MKVCEHTDVVSIDCSLWCPESQPNVLVPPPTTLPNALALCALDFVVEKDVRLLLESPLGLDRQLGRHGRSLVEDFRCVDVVDDSICVWRAKPSHARAKRNVVNHIGTSFVDALCYFRSSTDLGD